MQSDSLLFGCRGVVLLNGAGRIEDVQTAVEAPIATALSSTEKGVLAVIDPEDFSSDGHTASGMTAPKAQLPTSTSASQGSASQTQKPGPLSESSKEQKGIIQQVLAPLATIAKRVAVYGSFILTKQPSRVKQVLQQVCWLCCPHYLSFCPFTGLHTVLFCLVNITLLPRVNS